MTTGEEMIRAAIVDANDVRPDDETELQRLAALSPMAYDREREGAAERLAVRLGTIDAEVAKRRPAARSTSKEGAIVEEIEPWPEAVDGALLLSETIGVIRRFVVVTEGNAEAIALWLLHSHALDAFGISPVLAITSPQKGCGKTTLLALAGALANRPLLASNVSPAVVFRVVEACAPTLLIDEADTLALNDKGDLRGILNSSHNREGARVLRCDPNTLEPRQFSTWCAKAIACIGALPPTLADRSIEIRMARKRADERAERFSLLKPAIKATCSTLARKLARWAADHMGALSAADPVIPDDLHNRAADNWLPLLIVADCIGGGWPQRAREIARRMAGVAAREDDGAAVLLLSDIRDIFRRRQVERVSSTDLARELGAIEHRPWPEWYNNRPITPAAIARLLKPFGIEPKGIRIGQQTPKGYDAAWFGDAFARYLPRESATPQQSNENKMIDAAPSATEAGPVALADGENMSEFNGVADVALCTADRGTARGQTTSRRAEL